MGKKIYVVPNAIDTNLFRQTDKQMARKTLSFPPNALLIGAGAKDFSMDPNKGFDLFCETLSRVSRRLPSQKDIQIVLFGTDDRSLERRLPFPTIIAGSIQDSETLKHLYNALDLLVCTSRNENLPYVVMEAQACAVPVAAFDVGGLSDLVAQPAETLSPPYSTDHLAATVTRLIGNHEDRMRLGTAARLRMEASYGFRSVATKHLEIYQTVLNEDVRTNA
jgi:glycosyltransferase involved in cell wall biosynthesis